MTIRDAIYLAVLVVMERPRMSVQMSEGCMVGSRLRPSVASRAFKPDQEPRRHGDTGRGHVIVS